MNKRETYLLALVGLFLVAVPDLATAQDIIKSDPGRAVWIQAAYLGVTLFAFYLIAEALHE